MVLTKRYVHLLKLLSLVLQLVKKMANGYSDQNQLLTQHQYNLHLVQNLQMYHTMEKNLRLNHLLIILFYFHFMIFQSTVRFENDKWIQTIRYKSGKELFIQRWINNQDQLQVVSSFILKVKYIFYLTDYGVWQGQSHRILQACCLAANKKQCISMNIHHF